MSSFPDAAGAVDGRIAPKGFIICGYISGHMANSLMTVIRFDGELS